MSDQTWKKAILAIYWLLWDSALIEIFINNSHPGHLGCAPPSCPGKLKHSNHIWRFGDMMTTIDHGHGKRRGMGEGSSFEFLFEIRASTQNWKKILKIEEYFHEFTGAAAPVLVLSSGVGLPWSRVKSCGKMPALLLLLPSEEIRTEIRSFISQQQLRQKLLIYCLAWLFFLFNVYFSAFLGHLHRALGT